jgi:hypothetical protein
MRPICIVFQGQPYPLSARTGKAMVPVAVLVDGDNHFAVFHPCEVLNRA